jgi:hypothetical protein
MKPVGAPDRAAAAPRLPKAARYEAVSQGARQCKRPAIFTARLDPGRTFIRQLLQLLLQTAATLLVPIHHQHLQRFKETSVNMLCPGKCAPIAGFNCTDALSAIPAGRWGIPAGRRSSAPVSSLLTCDLPACLLCSPAKRDRPGARTTRILLPPPSASERHSPVFRALYTVLAAKMRRAKLSSCSDPMQPHTLRPGGPLPTQRKALNVLVAGQEFQ